MRIHESRLQCAAPESSEYALDQLTSARIKQNNAQELIERFAYKHIIVEMLHVGIILWAQHCDAPTATRNFRSTGTIRKDCRELLSFQRDIGCFSQEQASNPTIQSQSQAVLTAQ